MVNFCPFFLSHTSYFWCTLSSIPHFFQISQYLLQTEFYSGKPCEKRATHANQIITYKLHRHLENAATVYYIISVNKKRIQQIVNGFRECSCQHCHNYIKYTCIFLMQRVLYHYHHLCIIMMYTTVNFFVI